MRSKKILNDGSSINFHYLGSPEHQFLVDLSKHLVKPGLYFVSKPNGRPCSSGTLAQQFANKVIFSLFRNVFGVLIHEQKLVAFTLQGLPLGFDIK